ncbi:hypothetical protein Esi_0165_0032 [Ectocarpus siliculosus]|uniref:Uncharacterized protein n=1 Tax=Ectocarpus siliculosus TaxID=2880 RepID=D8LGA7_ECTSI|nr:hypothetical protein Esi_0165_0032 [Ectocarpus siliculosus]|eukprot:CBN79006.1 hypothetical protein Esi_0165_0032 [Ectocarpus siliculosus]
MVVVCNIQEEEQDGVEVLVEESDAPSETMKNFRVNYCGASIFGPYDQRLFSRGIEGGSRYFMYPNDGGSHAYSTGGGARADGGSHARFTEGGARTDGGNRTCLTGGGARTDRGNCAFSTGEEARPGGGTHAYSTVGGTREDGGNDAYSTGRGAREDGRNSVYSTGGGAGAGEGNHVYSIEGRARADGGTDVDSTGGGRDVGYVFSSRGRGGGDNSSGHGYFNASDTGPQEYSTRGRGTRRSSGSKGTFNSGGYGYVNEGGSYGYSNGGRARGGGQRNLSWADDGRQGRRHTTAAAAAATAAKIDRGDCHGRTPEEEQGSTQAAGGGIDGGAPDCAQKDAAGRSKQAPRGSARQEPAGDVEASIQAMLARQCTNTAGFQDRVSEAIAADRESHQYDNSCLDSSDDEEGGVGSLSQFSFRRNRQAVDSSSSSSSASRTSRPKTALQVMQEHKCACSTTEDSDRRTRSTSGRFRDRGGVTAGSTPGVPTGANGARGNPRAHATGGAYILRPDIPAPTSQSATPYMEPASLVRPPSLQRAPYLSLDGADEPVGDLAFDLSFDFPVAYGDGISDGNGSAATVATADIGGAPGLSVWNDYGLGLSGGDSSAVGRGGGGGGGAKAGINDLLSHEDDTYGILDDEDDEAALTLAADRLLGYDDPTTCPAGPSTAASTGAGPGPGSTPRPSRGPFPSSLRPPRGFSHPATMHTRQSWLGAVASAATGDGGAAGCTFFGESSMNPAVRGYHRRRSTSRLRFCSPDEGMGDGPVSCDDEDVTPSGLLAAVDPRGTERFPADGAEIGQVGSVTEAETVAAAVEGGKGTTSCESRNAGSSLCGLNQRILAPRPSPQPTFRTAENSRLFKYTRTSMVDQDYRAGDGGNNPGLSREVASPGEDNGTSPGKDDLANCPVLPGDGGRVCGDEGRGRGGGGSGGGGSGGGIAQELLGSGDSGGGIGRVDPVARGQRRFGIYPPAAAYPPFVSNGEGDERAAGLAGGEMGRAGVAPADNDDSDGSDDRHRADAVAAGALHRGEGISVAPSLPVRSAFISQPADGIAGTARAAEGSAVGVGGGRRILHDALLRGSASSGLLDVGGAVVGGGDDQRVVGGSGLAIEGNQGGSAEGLGIPAAVDGDVRAGGGVDGGGVVAVGGEDRDEYGGAAAEAMPTAPLAPSFKSWFGVAAASCAMGLLRRWAQRTSMAVATTTSTSERTLPESLYSPAAFTAGGKPSLAAISGGTRLGAGWRRHPGAIPYREDVSCSIEECGLPGSRGEAAHALLSR